MLDIYPVITYPNQVTDLVLINIERVSVVSITLSDLTSGHVILPNAYLIVKNMYKNRSYMINTAQI
jgi:hypothetical protein